MTGKNGHFHLKSIRGVEPSAASISKKKKRQILSKKDFIGRITCPATTEQKQRRRLGRGEQSRAGTSSGWVTSKWSIKKAPGAAEKGGQRVHIPEVGGSA